MKLASEHIEERRRFTPEERKAILKRTHGICACCGKKLTTKTMTVDHLEEKVTTIVVYEPEEPSEQGATDDKSGAIKRHKLEKEYDYLSYLIESKATLTEEEFERVQVYNRDIAIYDGLKPIALDGLIK